jgi:imidazolonepropionase-like amidohydrolase
VMVRECGFSALEAIQAATIGAASMMRLDDILGTLAPGKLADIIATRDNPLEDIRALRSVGFVMKNGQVARHDSQL